MLLPSPRTSDTNGAGHHGDGGMDLRTAVAEIPLLPTPAVNDMGAAYAPNGNGYGKSLNVEAQRLLPTPTTRDTKGENQRGDDTCLTGALLPTPRATDGTKGGPNQRGSSGDLMLPSAVNLLPTPRTRVDVPTSASAREKYSSGDSMGDVVVAGKWGEYEPAIRRWEALTRPAPAPTKLNATGNPKLSDEFDEWLMGLPAGWITDVPGVTWNEALKACGNGVVWQQAAAALRWLRGMATWAVAA